MLIIPAGQEVALQGIYSFFTLLLQSLPLVWFVYCEDNNVGGEADSMRWGLAVLVVFYIAAFLLTCFFMNETAAIEKSKSTLHLRLRPKVMLTEGRSVSSEV